MKTIEEKYQSKDEITQILDRSGMWIGSSINECVTESIYYPSKNILKETENISFNAGLHKLIDEVFSNSVDEYRRSKTTKKDSLFDVNKITVEINSNGYCCITDNGGIPVQIHKETGVYVPKMIFGMLRTSSNYDDTQDKEWVGTNGLGAKLTNIFSSYFEVETCDGKNLYKCRWENNMREVGEESITPTKEHYTKITFQIDLPRFEIDKIDTGNLRLLQRHCIDSAASNLGLIIDFKSDIADKKLNSVWKFDSFKDYVMMFIDKDMKLNDSDFMEIKTGRDTIILGFGISVPDMGFVNGALCNRGTHIRKIQKQVAEYMTVICQKEDMELITEKDVISRFTIFVNCIVHNPSYDSQSKTCLATKIDSSKLKIDDKSLTKLKTSTLFSLLKDYYNIKYKEEKKKELRKLNTAVKNTKSKKLIIPGIKDKSKNELWIFEGNSANGGFRKMRNNYQAAYLLRGKIKNTLNLSRSQIVENQELREIIAILGLQFEKPLENVQNIQYSKIVFCTDMDADGDHICGLLISFFAKHFPELFGKGVIFRALSPIIIVNNNSKKKESEYFYNMRDWELNKEKYNSAKFDIQYTKGLGGLVDGDYKEMLQNPKFLKFSLEKDDKEVITIWFDKSTSMRKEILMSENSSEFENDSSF